MLDSYDNDTRESETISPGHRHRIYKHKDANNQVNTRSRL